MSVLPLIHYLTLDEASTLCTPNFIKNKSGGYAKVIVFLITPEPFLAWKAFQRRDSLRK